MNKAFLIIIGLIIVLGVGFYIFNKDADNNGTATPAANDQPTEAAMQNQDINITPISHATMVLDWAGQIIYTDPVGGAAAFAGKPTPTIILITDIHGDHLNADTLKAVSKTETVIIAPQAVVDQLPKEGLAGTIVTLKNGETSEQKEFSIEAIPMYNVPESPTAPHTKGRGNGYIVEAGGKRVYIAGDTANTPEMRALQNIDIAFLPMNLPYTMSVDEAAQATLVFKPKRVIPYHYRNQDGSLADTNKFKQLVNAGDSNIQVDLLNFYPDASK